MKLKSILFTCLLFITGFSMAQVWAPEGAVWHYNFYHETTSGYVKIECIGDTLIQGKTCSILKKNRIYNNGFSEYVDTFDIGVEYTYLENNQVFYYRYGQFYVLYDFEAETGDSWEIAGYDPHPGPEMVDSVGTVKVDSISTEEINGFALKSLYLRSPDTSHWFIYGKAIERIGCLSYMFPEVYYYFVDMYEGGSLRCYYDPEFGLYQVDTTACDYVYMVGMEENNMEDQVQVYPNPANNYVQLNFPDYFGECKITMYSVLGVKVKSLKTTSRNVRMTLAEIPEGYYFLEIELPGSTVVVKKIMKENR